MDKQLIEISSSTILRVILIVLALVFLWLVRDIAVMLLFSIVIASAVDPIASWLQARRIPRVLGVLLVYVSAVLAIGAVIYLIVPPLVDEARALAARSPALVERLFDQFQNSGFINRRTVIFERVEDYLGETLQNLTRLTPQDFSGNFASGLGALVSGIVQVAGGVFASVVTVVVSFYLAVREKGIENFLRSVTPLEHEAYIVDLWQRTQHKMGRWVQGQLILAVVVGLLVYTGLYFLNVPFALTLALVAGALELIPMVGPVLAAIPAVIIAFFQGTLVGFLTTALYLVIQPIENHILVPQIMKKTLGLSPVIIILALLVGARLGGIVGMLLALPLAAALNEVFNDLTERRRKVAA